ncbi:P-loop containing nucleoside triphosphate hydrolase protein [Xylaria sp. FL1777]|nr:P-loop containing nucleoside triphosphate hydrolase protein [Xylaria sp. FL1777]
MSSFNSWEDDPAAHEEPDKQSQPQPQNGSRGFRPGAASFTPSAAAPSFTPSVPYQNPYPAQHGFSQHGYPPNMRYWQPYNAYGDSSSQVPYQGQYQNQYQNYQPQVPTRQYDGGPSSAPNPVDPIVKPPAVNEDAVRVTSPDAASQPSKKEDASLAIEAGTKVLSIGSTQPTNTRKTTQPAADTTPAPPKKAAAPKRNAEKASPAPSSGRSSPARQQATEARNVDAVAREQTADVDEQTLKEIYGKEHMNIIFIGHVDAGKSTLGGSILVTTGMVDQRTLEKYKKEAKDLGRESWYLSWALDLTSEERSKGKTVETGRAYFETDKRRYSILDAPGHKNFVPSMISGTSQADLGVLVISSRKGEYEAGFDRGGQTREHAMLAKTQGVSKLIVAINKMDDPTVQWSHDRYKECTTKLGQFLKGIGYDQSSVFFMPVAAQQSLNIKDRVTKEVCPWWDGPSLLEYLDAMQAPDRKLSAPFMMPVAGKFRDLGTMAEGKIEAGVVKKSMQLILMPNKQSVEVVACYTENEDEVGVAQCGDQVRLRLRGVEEDEVLPGFVLCSPKRLVHCVSVFEAQIRILELKTILTAGFNCVMHIHTAVEEVTFSALLHTLQKSTNKKSRRPPTHAKRGDTIIARLQVTGTSGAICIETYEDYPQMGRFTLRDQGQTIAIGKVTKLVLDTA